MHCLSAGHADALGSAARVENSISECSDVSSVVSLEFLTMYCLQVVFGFKKKKKADMGSLWYIIKIICSLLL